MKVSVIIPCYNGATYIENCVERVINQTYKNTEVIIVDDLSTDNSKDVILKIQNKYPDKVKVILSKVNNGPGGAKNEGLKIASGEYVMFVDCDDYIDNDYIEKLIAEVEKNRDLDLVLSGFKKIMKHYDLENTIVASNQGILNTANLKINKIKEQINKGLPVTIYTLRAGDGNLSNHYFNVYGYVEYSGYDEDDNYYFETLLKIRPNFNITDTCYADSVLLSSFFTGVIYYDIVYDEKTLVPTDFFQFVNTNGDGQYFNYEVEQSIAIDDEFAFDTKRLRCSYIEDTYLVLSAIKKNGVAIENTMQEAYLEMDFSDYDITILSNF